MYKIAEFLEAAQWRAVRPLRSTLVISAPRFIKANSASVEPEIKSRARQLRVSRDEASNLNPFGYFASGLDLKMILEIVDCSFFRG